MKVIDTQIPDVKILEPRVFGDERGFFFESYNHKVFCQAIGREVNFVQDNHSRSQKGVLRGLHYQMEPFSQGKLVRVTLGEVYDVAVDLRKSSETYGQSVGLHLSAENKRQLWVPEGFAHGFVTLSDHAEFLYKTTDYYHPEAEKSIRWNDETLNIDWQEIENPELSSKDLDAPGFAEVPHFS